MNKLPLFFQPPSLEAIASIKQSGEVVADGLFYLHSFDPSQLKLVLLVGNYLVQYEDHTRNRIRRIAQLDFDTKFLILIEESNGRQQGIKFEKQGFQAETIFSLSQDLLQKWKNLLQQRINQRGFHQLFKPIKKIGKGNFASVYLAERKEDGRMVAVKAFSKQITFSQQKGKQSLMNEIKLLRSLNNAHILKLYGVYESENSIYMTMQLLEGGQLYDKIQSRYKFTPSQVQQLMKSLLEGIQHMASHRIMHRDLKPQNIMLRTKNSMDLVIADFGLATCADEPQYLFVRCGTPGYVAPQIINIKNLKSKSDPICDMFSAGLIFHILLFGKSIFPGKNYNDVLAQNRACDYNLDQKQYHDLGLETYDLLKRMLDKNPLSRISATQALNHLYFKSSNTMEIQEVIPVSPRKKMQPDSPLMHNQPFMDKGNFQAPALKYKPSFLQNLSQKGQNRENVSRFAVVKSKSKYKQN